MKLNFYVIYVFLYEPTPKIQRKALGNLTNHSSSASNATASENEDENEEPALKKSKRGRKPR